MVEGLAVKLNVPANVPASDPAWVKQLLDELHWRMGEQNAQSLVELMTRCQKDLRAVAHAERIATRATDTMSTTALINEVYLRFAQNSSEFINGKHFFATAARAMRQILVDYVRSRCAQKRGSGICHEGLDQVQELLEEKEAGQDVLLLDQALDALEMIHPRPAQVVYFRYFVGMDDREIGELLGVDESTVRRDWLKARGWLYMHLEKVG
jgi:RNA polymerase sigma factor (TIGR02999 family)